MFKKISCHFTAKVLMVPLVIIKPPYRSDKIERIIPWFRHYWNKTLPSSHFHHYIDQQKSYQKPECGPERLFTVFIFHAHQHGEPAFFPGWWFIISLFLQVILIPGHFGYLRIDK
jgi:hypothetical protein